MPRPLTEAELEAFRAAVIRRQQWVRAAANRLERRGVVTGPLWDATWTAYKGLHDLQVQCHRDASAMTQHRAKATGEIG